MLTRRPLILGALAIGATVLLAPALAKAQGAPGAQKKPNVVMLMQDDTGFSDFGAYLGGRALGHPTPNVDQLAKEGAMFTSWYGQASCTAGRVSFMTGRIPIRPGMSDILCKRPL
jgi:arylsulfatase